MICGGGGSWDSKPDADAVNRCEDLVLKVVSCNSFVTTQVKSIKPCCTTTGTGRVGML